MTRNSLLALAYIFIFFANHCVGANVFDESSITIDKANVSKQKILKILPDGCHFSGRFSQHKTIEGLIFPLASNGDFFFSCDLGLVWNTFSPIQEALLYTNSKINFRMNDKGNVELISGVVTHVVSDIFLKILKGDVDYFISEFSVRLTDDRRGVELRPKSSLLQKAINYILIRRYSDDVIGVAVEMIINTTAGQETKVTIDNIEKYSLEDRRAAYEQCQAIYNNSPIRCRALFLPDHYIHNSSAQ